MTFFGRSDGCRVNYETLDETVPGIRVPTFVLQGTADRIVDPENPRVLADAIPGAELVWLVGAGHLYHSEQADAADGAIFEFIERRSP